MKYYETMQGRFSGTICSLQFDRLKKTHDHSPSGGVTQCWKR